MNTSILNALNIEPTEVAPGTVLIREGSDNTNVYVLVSGKAEVSMRGNSIAVVDRPGTALGQVAVILGKQPVATTTVLEPSAFFVISDFLTFLREHPDACVSTAQELAAQMVSSVNHMVWMKEQLAELQKAMEIYVPAFPDPGEEDAAPGKAG